MSDTCGVYPLTLMSANCAGHGTCEFSSSFNQSVCSCSPGWFGESDFQVTTSLTDCHLNTALLQALWALYLALHLLLGGIVISKVRDLYRAHVLKFDGTVRFFFTKRSAIHSIESYLLLGYPCQLAYAITKLVHPFAGLGNSVFLTVLYILWRFTFYYSAHCWYTGLLRSLLSNQRQFQRVLPRVIFLSRVYLFIANVLSVFPVLPLIDSRLAVFSVVFFLNGCALALLYYSCISHYVQLKILSALAHHAESHSSTTKDLFNKFAALMRKSRNVGLSQALLYLLFGCIPYFYNKHDYLIMFAWLPVLAIILSIVSSLKTEENPAAVSHHVKEDHNDDQPTPHHRQKGVNETAVNTIDCESVIDVTEDSPALLATSPKWNKS